MTVDSTEVQPLPILESTKIARSFPWRLFIPMRLLTVGFPVILLTLAVTACGPSAQETAVSATVAALRSQATIQAAVDATVAAIPTATSVPPTVTPEPTETPVPATDTPVPAPTARPATSTPLPRPIPPTPVTPVIVNAAPAQSQRATQDASGVGRPGVGQTVTVGSLGYMVPDGQGKALAGEAAVAVLTQNPKAILGAVLSNQVWHLIGGTHVKVLDPPGAHGTHVQVLDGAHAGQSGSMLNRSLGF